MLTAIDSEAAKSLAAGTRYTGFVAATHASYADIEKAGIAVGKIKPRGVNSGGTGPGRAGGASRAARTMAPLAPLGWWRLCCWPSTSHLLAAGRQVDLARLAERPAQDGPLDRCRPGRRRWAELPTFLLRTAETVAMAALGTTAAVLLALPMAVLAARNVTPWPRAVAPARLLLNALRGIDAFVFALLFVAAVGLGPFRRRAGHRAAHLGQRGQEPGRPHRERLARSLRGGAQHGRVHAAWRWLYAVLPDVLPVLLSMALFWWEFNVRASTVLGVVGARAASGRN